MQITDELLSHVAALAQLRLADEAREQARDDLSRMIAYVDKLSELDTSGVAPMSHALSAVNVLREDDELPGMARELILANAPAQKDGCFLVPKTVE